MGEKFDGYKIGYSRYANNNRLYLCMLDPKDLEIYCDITTNLPEESMIGIDNVENTICIGPGVPICLICVLGSIKLLKNTDPQITRSGFNKYYVYELAEDYEKILVGNMRCVDLRYYQ